MNRTKTGTKKFTASAILENQTKECIQIEPGFHVAGHGKLRPEVAVCEAGEARRLLRVPAKMPALPNSTATSGHNLLNRSACANKEADEIRRVKIAAKNHAACGHNEPDSLVCLARL